MHYSNCCGASSPMIEIDICPECLEHCEWDFEEDDEEENEDSFDADAFHEQSKINEHE